LKRELEAIRTKLSDYIQATYHISHPALVASRRDLLTSPRTLQQSPWVESAARYVQLESHALVDMPQHVQALFASLVAAKLAFPPYTHQATALARTLGADRRDLVVTTGTGSGKTETFLHPVLGRLYDEAVTHPERFSRRAIRSLVLYPMNALVNDQLGRLRQLFGAQVVRDAFTAASGRPAKFARYTGRTLYPGSPPKTTAQLSKRLKPLTFYADRVKRAADGDVAEERLIEVLKAKGRWPGKPSFERWYWGSSGRRWRTKDDEQIRAVELPEDAELLLRQEVQAAVPDLFMTNYSMLEYTLLRPIERGIWKQTQRYYQDFPEERLMLILDEAHLYRGASGTEVALLIRRLKARLGLREDQLQVICTSASFDGASAAPFAAELTGRPVAGFEVLTGDKRAELPSGPGTRDLAEALAKVDARALLDAPPDVRSAMLAPLIGDRPDLRDVSELELPAVLHKAIGGLPVTGRLLNLTSGARADVDPCTTAGGGAAKEVGALSVALFEDTPPELARRATDTLLELAASARARPGDPPLLAARVHAFFRALPGVWICTNPECEGVPAERRGGPSGKMFLEPRVLCDSCGCRVFELHTCRDCGLAVAVGYARSGTHPRFLWPEAGGGFDSSAAQLVKIHLALEPPTDGDGGLSTVDSLCPKSALLGTRAGRDVWRAPDGAFKRCPRCHTDAEDKISGHATAGDQPFQALVTTQLLTQAPDPSSKTPLRGRKVMIFSDGRQSASRLSGNLKAYSLRDAARPLVLIGFAWLEAHGIRATLDLAYGALLIGCALRNVTLAVSSEGADRLREAMARTNDNIMAAGATADEVREEAVRLGADTPKDVLLALYEILFRQHTGMEALGLATFAMALPGPAQRAMDKLPAPPGQGSEDDRRRDLSAVWARHAAERGMILLPNTPAEWIDAESGGRVRRHKVAGDFLRLRLPAKVFSATLGPRGGWQRLLEQELSDGPATEKGVLVRASHVSLVTTGIAWGRCERCTRVQPLTQVSPACFNCKEPHVVPLDPTTDLPFRARAGFYRDASARVTEDRHAQPLAFVAEEHSAQLGQAMDGELFARTERYELRFQDVELPKAPGESTAPVDVLSCTTTMEVGIDIGSLTGVALRNVPPGRANYQQRAGRAGRRGASLATVITWCSADSHDRRFYEDPAGMVSGPVKDPHLDLGNADIVRRHAFASMISMFQLEAIPDADARSSNLFMSLGPVETFRAGSVPFSYQGLEDWLSRNASEVEDALLQVVPPPLDGDDFVRALPGDLLKALVNAGCGPSEATVQQSTPPPAALPSVGLRDSEEDEEATEAGLAEAGDSTGDTRLLLDRLFADGLLPRYAFPTDVATFHVFRNESERRPGKVFKYRPQQGRGVALTQYAPGREVWVDGQRWRSLALFDPFTDHHLSWRNRRLFLQCTSCGFAKLMDRVADGDVQPSTPCPACSSPAMAAPLPWIVPPGFAHPVDQPPAMAGEDAVPTTRASRAKLSRPMEVGAETWRSSNGRAIGWATQEELTLTNRGSTERDGTADNCNFIYCAFCGRIEPKGWKSGVLNKGGGHKKPYPLRRDESPQCTGHPSEVVLGTQFRTDVAVFRLRFDALHALRPGETVTRLVLTTLAEAITAAGRVLLDLDEGEVATEHRPALTDLGPTGEEIEIYLYDAVPGGAGYARELCRRGDELFEEALRIMEGCIGDGTPEAPRPCDQSCYHCLRSFSNRWHHGDLDRLLGAAALRHALFGDKPTLDPQRATALLASMASWINAEGEGPVEVIGDKLVLASSAVTLRHPLAPAEAGTVSALLAERALPDACALALGYVEDSIGDAVLGLPEAPDGIPVFRGIHDLVAGLGPIQRVRRPMEHPKASAFVFLNARLVELHPTVLGSARWALCQEVTTFSAAANTLTVIALRPDAPQPAFHATQARQTIASVTVQGDRATLKYRTRSAWGRTETLPLTWLEPRFILLEARP
jgi:Lhr-like helicase